jgi:hypothetical protein
VTWQKHGHVNAGRKAHEDACTRVLLGSGPAHQQAGANAWTEALARAVTARTTYGDQERPSMELPWASPWTVEQWGNSYRNWW